MANALVEQLRRNSPAVTAGRSDAELTELIADRLQARGDLAHFQKQFPDFNSDLLGLRNEGGDIVRETVAAGKAGMLDRAPATVQNFGAMTADMAASEDLALALGLDEPLRKGAAYLRGLAKENQDEAAARVAEAGGRTIRRVEDVRGGNIRDWLLWGMPTAAETAPSMLASLGAGGAAAIATRGAILPTMLAGGAAGYVQNAGDVYGDLIDKGVDPDRAASTAAVTGVPMALLDIAGELLPLAKLSKVFKGAPQSAIVSKLADVAGRGGLAGAGKGAITTAITEGTTEALQELVAIAGEEYATGEQVPDDELQSRLKNAAAGGAIVGGPAGAIFGAIPNAPTSPNAPAAPTPAPTSPPPPVPNAPPPGAPVNPPADPLSGLAEAVDPAGDTPVDARLQTRFAPRVDPSSGLLQSEDASGETPIDARLQTRFAPRIDPSSGLTETEGASGETPVDALLATKPAKPPVASAAAPAFAIADPAPSRIAKTTSNDLTGDQGRGGMYAIALEKDGRVEVRNVYERKDGTRIVENAADIVPEIRVKGNGRNIGSLEKSGWTVVHRPFLLAQRTPHLKATFTREQFDGVIGQSASLQNSIVQAINEGRGDLVVQSALQSDPMAWSAVQFLRDVIAASAGASPSHALIALGTRVDSVAARDGLRASATSKKLAAGDILRRKNGKVFGVFTEPQWKVFQQAVSEGRGDEALRKHFGGDNNAQAWMHAMADLGAAEQAGAGAFTGTKPGATVSLDESTAEISEGDDPTEDIPLSDGGGGAARAALLESGFDDNAIHAAVTEMLDFEDLSASDVLDIIRTLPEAEPFLLSLRRQGPQGARAALETATQNLLTLHDEANRTAGTPPLDRRELARASGDAAGTTRPGEANGRAPGATASEVRKSQPVDSVHRASDHAAARAWGIVASVLRDAGIDVRAIQAAIDQATGGATPASFESRRFVELVLKDLAAPSRTDLEVAVHEAVHVLFGAQSPELREALHRAVAKLPDPDPSINLSLQETDPAIRAEEKLAVLLQGDGMEAGQARGFASRLVRFVKDIYLRAARALSLALGLRETADAFALRYFQNRMAGLLQGDYAPQSLINAMGGRPLTWTERAVLLPGFGRSIGRVVNGQMLWASKVPNSPEAVRFNTELAFSRPPLTEGEANVRKGIDAVNAVLADKKAVIRGAMYRAEVGSITFEWGEPGNPAKSFRGGYGIGHIIARRSVVGGQPPVETLASLIETIAYGDASAPYGGEGDTRVRIDDGNNSVILSLARNGKRETWVITSFERDASATGAAARYVPPTAASQAPRAFSPEDLVAVTDGLKLGARLQVVKRDGMVYSRPRRGSIGSLENPELVLNRDIAALNYELGADASANTVLSGSAAINSTATAAGRPPIEWFRALLGMASPAELKMQVLNTINPRTQQPIQGMNPAATFADIPDGEIATTARIHAYMALEDDVRAISKSLTAARAALPAVMKDIDAARNALLDEHQNYLNQEKLTSLVQGGLRRLIARERKLRFRGGQQYGTVMQQVRELDARSDETIDREYAPVFQKLFAGDQLRGRNLFTLLDLLVNEVKVDFSDKIGDIRRRIGERISANVGAPAELGLLIQGTPTSRALLATVIAYGKANARVLAQIERRRLKNLDERMKLQGELGKVIAGEAITDQAVRDLSKSAKLEERARLFYRQAVESVRPLKNKLRAIEQKIEAAELALPIYQKALADMQAEVGIRPEYTFGDGMQYPVPTANSQGAIEFPLHTLQLDSTRGVTDRDTVKRHVAAMTDWMIDMEHAGTITPRYFDVMAARDALLRSEWESELRKSDAFVRGNLLLPVGEVAAASGLPTGRIVRERLNRYAATEKSLHAPTTRAAIKVEHTRDRALAVLNRGRSRGARMTVERFEDTIAQPALEILNDGTTDLRLLPMSDEQRIERAMQRVLNHLLSNPDTAPFIRGKDVSFSTALRAHVEARAAASKLLNDTHVQWKLPVRDERIVGVSRADGEETVGVRDSIAAPGVLTVSRTSNALAGRTYRGLVAAGWATFRDKIPALVDAYRQGGAAAIDALSAPWFGDARLTQNFVGSMAENPVHAIFDAPVLPDGITRPEANPEATAAAWRASNGSVGTFIETMHAVHNGVSPLDGYVNDTLTRLAEYFSRLSERLEPSESGMIPDDLTGLTSDLMIDARTAERWPIAWTRYLGFTQPEMHRLVRRTASQIAFGRDTGELARLWATMEGEITAATDKLADLRSEFGDDKPGRKAIVAHIGASELERLERIEKLAPRLADEKTKLRAYFRRENSTIDGNNFLSALGSFVAFGMLNNPGSALLNLSDTFAPLVQGGGVSRATLRQVADSWRELGHGMAGSLAQMVGVELKHSSDEARAYHQEGFTDAATSLNYIAKTEDGLSSDILSGLRSIDASIPTKALQAFTRTLSIGVAPRGEKSTYTAFRPFAPFQQFVLETMRASTIATWRRVGNMVLVGMDYIAANPQAAKDPAFRLTASVLGLKGSDSATFEALRIKLAENYGLDLADMVRGAMLRRAGPRNRMELLTRVDRALIQGMVASELILDSNLATMSPRAYGLIGRMVLPLLGWPLRRAMQLGRIHLDATDRYRIEVLARGLGALGVMAAGGLAMSLLADEYHEEVVGRKRNLRSVKALPSSIGRGDAGAVFFTVTENLNRAGTFGAWGEIINLANAAAGEGDNRTISLDSRVVLFNSIHSLRRAFSAFVAQDGDVDYSSIVRPAMMALGGNSTLQYLQIGNNALGLDNAEARFIERVDAHNRLRVAGRELGLEVRKSAGGEYTPTSLTPHIARMVLAAYAGDRGDFLTAWRAAVQEAKQLGEEDPVSHVRDAFARRNPLKNAFSSISQDGYIRLLRHLDDDGRRAVRGAVDRFNAYAESLDAKAFVGSVSRSRTTDTDALRRKILGL